MAIGIRDGLLLPFSGPTRGINSEDDETLLPKTRFIRTGSRSFSQRALRYYKAMLSEYVTQTIKQIGGESENQASCSSHRSEDTVGQAIVASAPPGTQSVSSSFEESRRQMQKQLDEQFRTSLASSSSLPPGSESRATPKGARDPPRCYNSACAGIHCEEHGAETRKTYFAFRLGLVVLFVYT